jgi:hypothetical protein
VTVSEAAKGKDVVIVTIPQKNIPKLPSDLFEGVPNDVVVVDTGNYYPQQRDGRIEGIENGATESRWVSDQLGRPVVKAFNNILRRSSSAPGPSIGSTGPHRVAGCRRRQTGETKSDRSTRRTRLRRR